MRKKRAFISFDYDNDVDLKNLLVGQARNTDSPFEIIDLSIKEAIDQNWKIHARRRIKGCDCVCVICGEHTDKACGVSAEIRIAQEGQKVSIEMKLLYRISGYIKILVKSLGQTFKNRYSFNCFG